MARTKHTDRKEPNRPPQATKSFVCDVCQNEFGQSTNYNRHLGLIHRLNRDGSAIDGATYAKYAAYSQRGKRQPKAAELAGSVSTTESTVTRPKKTRKPRSRKHQFVQSDSSSSSDEFWVVVSEAEADYEDESASYAEPDQPDSPMETEPKSSLIRRTETLEIDVTKRRPTRPQKPSVRRISTTARPMHEADPLPKTVRPPSKRRLEIAPSFLAKKIAERHDQSSLPLAAELGDGYSWTGEEKRQKTNIIRGMRAMERLMCVRIRQSLPLNQTAASVEQFLEKLENDCRHAEDRDSDEFL